MFKSSISEEVDRKVRQLHTQLAVEAARCQDYAARIQALENSVLEKDAEVNALRENVVHLSEKVATGEERIRSLSNELKKRQDSKKQDSDSRAEQTRHQYELLVSNKDAQIGRLTTTINELREVNTFYTAIVAQRDAEEQAARTGSPEELLTSVNWAKLIDKSSTLKRLEILENEKERLANVVNHLQLAHDSSASESERIRSENCRLVSELADLEEENDKLRRALSSRREGTDIGGDRETHSDNRTPARAAPETLPCSPSPPSSDTRRTLSASPLIATPSMNTRASTQSRGATNNTDTLSLPPITIRKPTSSEARLLARIQLLEKHCAERAAFWGDLQRNYEEVERGRAQAFAVMNEQYDKLKGENQLLEKKCADLTASAATVVAGTATPSSAVSVRKLKVYQLLSEESSSRYDIVVKAMHGLLALATAAHSVFAERLVTLERVSLSSAPAGESDTPSLTDPVSASDGTVADIAREPLPDNSDTIRRELRNLLALKEHLVLDTYSEYYDSLVRASVVVDPSQPPQISLDTIRSQGSQFLTELEDCLTSLQTRADAPVLRSRTSSPSSLPADHSANLAESKDSNGSNNIDTPREAVPQLGEPLQTDVNVSSADSNSSAYDDSSNVIFAEEDRGEEAQAQVLRGGEEEETRVPSLPPEERSSPSFSSAAENALLLQKLELELIGTEYHSDVPAVPERRLLTGEECAPTCNCEDEADEPTLCTEDNIASSRSYLNNAVTRPMGSELIPDAQLEGDAECTVSIGDAVLHPFTHEKDEEEDGREEADGGISEPPVPAEQLVASEPHVPQDEADQDAIEFGTVPEMPVDSTLAMVKNQELLPISNALQAPTPTDDAGSAKPLVNSAADTSEMNPPEKTAISSNSSTTTSDDSFVADFDPFA